MANADAVWVILKAEAWLEASWSTKILGAAVPNFYSPSENFTPTNPTRYYKPKDLVRIKFNDFVLPKRQRRGFSVEGKLMSLFGAKVESVSADGVDLTSKMIELKRLSQHDDYWDKIRDDPSVKLALQKWIRNARMSLKKEYVCLVVGIALCSDVEIEWDDSRVAQRRANLELPVDEIMVAAGVPLPVGPAANPRFTVSSEAKQVSVFAVKRKEQSIFALELKVIERKGWTQKDYLLSARGPNLPPNRHLGGDNYVREEFVLHAPAQSLVHDDPPLSHALDEETNSAHEDEVFDKKMASGTKDNASWTAYPSLLNTISSDDLVEAIERVAEARQLGRYDRAQVILDNELADLKSVPLVIFEQADLLTDQGLEGDRLSFLEKVKEHTSLDRHSNEYKLICLMLTDAKFWVNGNLREALEGARQSRDWLSAGSLDELTDLQIRGVHLYLSLIKVAFTNSNWVQPSERTASPGYQGTAADECYQIWRSLRGRGKLAAAARMALEQMGSPEFVPSTEIFNDIIELCLQLDSTLTKPLAFRSLYTMKTLVESTSENGLVELTSKCQAILDTQLPRFKHQHADDWALLKMARRQEIKETKESELSPKEKSGLLSEISDHCVRFSDLTTANSALLGAVTLARAWDNEASDADSTANLRALEVKLWLLHRERTKNVYFEAAALQTLTNSLFIRNKAYEDVLRQISRFEEEHRDFDIPLFLELAHDKAKISAQNIERKEALRKYSDAWFSNFEKSPFANSHEHTGPLRTSYAEYQNILRRIFSDATDALAQGKNAMEIALEYAEEEFKSGTLSQEEWERAFGFYATGSEQPFDVILHKVTNQPNKSMGSLFSSTRSEWVERFNNIKDVLLAQNRSSSRQIRIELLHVIAKTWAFEQRKHWAEVGLQRSVGPEDVQHLTEDFVLAEEMQQLSLEGSSIPRLPPPMVKKRGNIFQALALATASMQPSAVQRGILTQEMLECAIQDSEDLFQEYQQRQNFLGMYTTLSQKADLIWQKFVRFQSGRPEDSVTTLARAERVLDEVRRHRSVSRDGYSIKGKTKELQQYNARFLYNRAIWQSRIAFNLHNADLQAARQNAENSSQNEAQRVYIQGLEATFLQSYREFLNWTQKVKSRAIFDLLRLDAPIPPDILEECRQDKSAWKQISREQEVMDILDKTAFPGNLQVREELEALRSDMREDPILRQFMRFRDGDTITAQEVHKMLQGLPSSIVVVDFLYVDLDPPLRALCYRKDLTYFPALIHDISMPEIKAWASRLSEIDEPLSGVDDGKIELARLTKLLEPLFKVMNGSPHPVSGPAIRPGDTIIFCATDSLHRIPLHAIPIDGKPIIESHPVVYCPSLTVLHHSIQSVHAALKNPAYGTVEAKRVVVNTMHSYWSSPHTPENEVKSIAISKSLAQDIHAIYHGGTELTRLSAMELCTGASLLHYHGHAEFNGDDAMDSCLILEGEEKAKNDDAKLAAKDIFETRLAPPALATIVGCRSGVAEISATDDILGLPTALMYAGATTTVSTLWKIKDEDGAAWAKEFYRALLAEEVAEHEDETEVEERRSPGVRLLNAARAMQKAVMTLRMDAYGERAPYCWAGFVLSGYWMVPWSTQASAGHSPVVDLSPEQVEQDNQD